MKTPKEIQKIFEEEVDWIKVHHMLVDDFGRRVEFWLNDEDGIELVTMEQNTFQPGVEIIGSLPCWGGNLDRTEYAKGWTTKNEDGTYTVTETGETLSEDEMIHRCIDDGDFPDFAENCIQKIMDQYEQES